MSMYIAVNCSYVAIIHDLCMQTGETALTLLATLIAYDHNAYLNIYSATKISYTMKCHMEQKMRAQLV